MHDSPTAIVQLPLGQHRADDLLEAAAVGAVDVQPHDAPDLLDCRVQRRLRVGTRVRDAPTGATRFGRATRESWRRSGRRARDHSRIERLDRLLGMRFAAPGDLDHAAHERHPAGALAKQALGDAAHHRLQLARRPGQQQHDTVAVLDPEARAPCR